MHDGYDSPTPMTLEQVVIMGLRDDVTQVLMGTIPIDPSQYSQDSITKAVSYFLH